MHILILAIVLLIAFYVTMNYGVGRAVAVVYLPAILMLSKVLNLAKPVVLDLDAVNAAAYGVLLGIPFARQKLTYRPHFLDGIVVLLTAIVVVSGIDHGEFYTGVSYFIRDFLTRLTPYFLCRVALASREDRQWALKALMTCAFIICLCAVVEVRLWPQWIHHLLYKFKMGPPPQRGSLQRFGFFRVYGITPHPIYFGNICLLLFGWIVVLATTTGRKLNERWVLLALGAAAASVFFSLSFTPFIGAGAAIGIYLVIRYQPAARYMLVPGVIVLIIGLFAFSQHLAEMPISRTEGAGEFQSSFEIRQFIIRGSWQLAKTAPAWGWGRDFEWTEYKLDSVDNSYLVFAIQYGLMYMWLWISIAVVIAYRATFALGRVTTPQARTGLAAGTAILLGLMVAMYTVWAGAVYTIFWMALLGFMNSLYQWTLNGAPETARSSAQQRVTSNGSLRLRTA